MFYRHSGQLGAKQEVPGTFTVRKSSFFRFKTPLSSFQRTERGSTSNTVNILNRPHPNSLFTRQHRMLVTCHHSAWWNTACWSHVQIQAEVIKPRILQNRPTWVCVQSVHILTAHKIVHAHVFSFNLKGKFQHFVKYSRSRLKPLSCLYAKYLALSSS